MTSRASGSTPTCSSRAEGKWWPAEYPIPVDSYEGLRVLVYNKETRNRWTAVTIALSMIADLNRKAAIAPSSFRRETEREGPLCRTASRARRAGCTPLGRRSWPGCPARPPRGRLMGARRAGTPPTATSAPFSCQAAARQLRVQGQTSENSSQRAMQRTASRSARQAA